MEPHQDLPAGTEKFRPDLKAGARAYFRKAHEFTRTFYGAEMDSIQSVQWEKVDDDFFFQEYVWVVHATGFSAKAVGRFMPNLVKAYGRWDKLGSKKDFAAVMDRVRTVCNNPQKAKAVHSTAQLMVKELISPGGKTWAEFRKERLSSPEEIAKLPYVGKITCFHLARNIGLLECVKPDLHLVRMAEHWGYKDCAAMCEDMRKGGFEHVPLGIVDLCVWYAASTFGTLDIRKEGGR